MKRPSTRFFISMGLAAMVATVLLASLFFDLVPDTLALKRGARASLAESVAASTSALASDESPARIEALLGFVVSRNPELQSAAVRLADGSVFASAGTHAGQWKPLEGEASIDGQLQVPIFAGKSKWGQLEIRFEPLAPPGWLAYLTEPRIHLLLFMLVFCFATFYIYLGKVLKQLDPSSAIPGRVRAAFDTLVEGMIVVDTRGEVMLANQAFGQFSGADPDSLLAKPVSGFAWASEEGQALDAGQVPWHPMLERAEPVREARVCLADPDGKVRTFLVNASPVFGANGKPAGGLISLEDITTLMETERQLREAKAAADDANRSKSDFLANMSHEIRTPMNAIIGFADLLRRGMHKSEQELNKHLGTIHSSGRHLLELINDILDLSKVEAGRIEYERAPCSPLEIAHDVAEIMRGKAEEKGIGLDIVIDGRIPSQIVTDAGRLRQAVMNLASNAVKFTEKGSVRIALSTQRTATGPRVAIAVTDSGIGIPADKLDTIFDPFTQAESSTTRRFGGTGLGLTISRRFARDLGGDIVVASRFGEGSTFTVSVAPGPLEHVEWLGPEDVERYQHQSAQTDAMQWVFPKGGTVLVVDDGAENRELVRLLLEESGLVVREAENGRIGVDAVSAGGIDLVLMDMQMPVMDGFTATRLLRDRGFELPIFALTANAMKGFEREILEIGCTGYLTKPVEIDKLFAAIAEPLGGVLEKAAPRAASRREAAPAIDGADGDAPSGPIRSRLAGHARLARVAQTFAVALAEKATEVEADWSRRDFEAIARFAHWLKGSAGTAGYDDFTEPAKALERHAKALEEAACARSLAQVRTMISQVEAPAADSLPESA